MTKDEMKDRISMVLKDPILQQGFEIICKENTNLAYELQRCRNEIGRLQLLLADEIHKHKVTKDKLTELRSLREMETTAIDRTLAMAEVIDSCN